MYLFFDTETTGLPRNWKAPVNDLSNWPRLVQLAYLLYDNSGNLISGSDHIIKPEDFKIPVSASSIHGITHEKACVEGKPLAAVMNEFLRLLDKAEILVAHNMSFDENILGAEFLRLNMPNVIPGKNRICTMLKSTHFCKLNGPYGYKWPKLSELHYTLFNSAFAEAHNASVDIKATAKCFWELRKKGIV
jgi:DNA polymerase III epsilon subunit-like protein